MSDQTTETVLWRDIWFAARFTYRTNGDRIYWIDWATQDRD